MKTVNLLLGNSEDLLNNLIESAVQEVCGDQTTLKCSKTAWLEEFVGRARNNGFDVVILIPNNLLSESHPAPSNRHNTESINAIRAIRSVSSTPIIAITVFDQRRRAESLLLEAGVNCVLDLPFDLDELKSAVRRLMAPSLKFDGSPSGRWSFSTAFMRALERPAVS